MKTKYRMVFICAIFQIIFYNGVVSQINPGIRGKPSDFKMLEGRTLLVELKEEDSKKIEKLTKKGKTKEVLSYKENIANYNKYIQNAVSKYWTFNKNIEYKLTSEIDKIKNYKSYVLLQYRWLESRPGVMNINPSVPMSVTIPLIAYNRLENRSDDYSDNQVYLPPTKIPDVSVYPSEWNYSQSSFNFAIRELQANIEYIIATSKQILFKDYAVKISEDGKCEKLKSTNILIRKSDLDKKTTENDLKSIYSGAYSFVDDSTFEHAFVNQEEGKAVMFIVPYTLGISNGMNQVNWNIACFKIVVECKTGNILYMYKTEDKQHDWDWNVCKFTFEAMSACKSK